MHYKISKVVKNENFQKKIFNIFLIFAQNIEPLLLMDILSDSRYRT